MFIEEKQMNNKVALICSKVQILIANVSIKA